MKKVLHTTVLSAFLLASTQTMAANQPSVTEVSTNQQQIQQNIETKDQYSDLRHASANTLNTEQAKEVDAGVNPLLYFVGGMIAEKIFDWIED